METSQIKTSESAGKIRAEKIVRVDALVSFGVSVAEACRREGFPRATYYRMKSREASSAKEAA